MSSIPIIGQLPQPARTIEVCRSFSYKLNHELYGGPRYENSDYFASRKSTVPLGDDAAESERIYQECRAEVMLAVAQTIGRLRARYAKREEKLA